MAATGVKVDDSIQGQYNDYKLGRLDAKYITYKIDGGKIVVDKVGGPKASTNFSHLIKDIPPSEPRYIVYDLDYKSKDGRDVNKLVFVAW